MKIKKDALRDARKILSACTEGGRVDVEKVRRVVRRLGETKPRGYLGVATALGRLVRLEIVKNQAIVESAMPLDVITQHQVTENLRAKYGNQIDTEFRLRPELIGGMRIRVGSDVWDGSVKNRIERLEIKFT